VSPLLSVIGIFIEALLFLDTQLDSGFELFCWTELEQRTEKSNREKVQFNPLD